MALKDLFSFFTPDAKEQYHAKPYDPVKARGPLLTGIKRSRDDFNADKFTKPNRWFSVKNNAVAFHPKLNGRVLTINGVDENHMPSERFIEFLDLMQKEVEAGEFDEVIANHGKGNTDVHIGKAKRSAKPASEKPWQVRKDWATVDRADKQSIGASYNKGRNPDQTLISEVGHKPDAKIVRAN